ncbi:MAG: dihydropteroate synthase [Hyphomicrobiaceae bacterium]|nr:dihydropteroate synthase [Hyphomicrobiaceae bacterium]
MTSKPQKSKLIVIGENINTTRRIKADSPNIVKEDGKVGYVYTDLDGSRALLDITDIYPKDPNKIKTERIGHIGQAIRKKDLRFLKWAILAQVNAGSEIIDLCVDELSVYPEERLEYMRWTVRTAQQLADVSFALDSSDPKAIQAGLEVYDHGKSRPAINSTSLEAGRDVLMDLAREHKCMLFANGSGVSGMPQDAEQRVENMTQCMALMDKAKVPVEDRYLDPLVFPVGAGPQFGKDYLDAVGELRKRFPEVHIFGGLSNVSFGLPRRKLLNDAFIRLSIMRGCDAIMIDPLMNPPLEYVEFKYAANVMTADDEYAIQYLKYVRGNAKKPKPASASAAA